MLSLSVFNRQGESVGKVEIDPAEINKNVKVDVGLVRDVKRAIGELLPRVQRRDRGPWMERIASRRAEARPRDIQQRPGRGRLYAAHVLHELWRLTGGKAMMDAGQGVPAGLRETTAASLDESARLLETWNGAAGGRLRYAYAPRFVLSCTDELIQEVARQARQRGVRVHTHASENAP